MSQPLLTGLSLHKGRWHYYCVIGRTYSTNGMAIEMIAAGKARIVGTVNPMPQLERGDGLAVRGECGEADSGEIIMESSTGSGEGWIDTEVDASPSAVADSVPEGAGETTIMPSNCSGCSSAAADGPP